MRADQHARRDAFLGKIGTRPVVMGILNVTADSFSDGGRFVAVEVALADAQQLAMHGCDQDRLDLGRLLASATGATVRMAQFVVIGWPSSDIIFARSSLERSPESTSTPSLSKITRFHGEPVTERAVAVICRQDISTRIL